TDAIGESAGRALSETTTPRQLSELALVLLGPLVLQRVVEHMRKEGLNPPARWGTVDARHFVSQIGFPEDFAIAAESKRDPELIVAGPIQLPPLHDFQEEVVEGLRSICSRSDGRRRAVVCLPTGGGKTRATVQAAVELILSPPSKQRSVLWIAQTDELCEQAVQAFRQVWANVGAESTDLRVVRLWGGHHSPARSEDGQPVVVVASIQTLNSRVGQEDLAWLSTPGLVVIDE
ncbi:MAG: DEAD/DEAH box helicase, partial [Verrucomicrobiaceae bacterium]